MKSTVKAIAAMLGMSAVVGLITFLVRQRTIDGLTERNRTLQRQLHEAQSDRQVALAKAAARETELESTRLDSIELARLR
jgi:F0F1-type ATP synthase membrane subunit b/b'